LILREGVDVHRERTIQEALKIKVPRGDYYPFGACGMGIFRDPFLMALSKRLRLCVLVNSAEKVLRTDLSRKLWQSTTVKTNLRVAGLFF